uniref:MPN domain containing n=1 Tax=Oreochromis niloticus TaxID=8128 RepID=A0A669B0S6_ORENI
ILVLLCASTGSEPPSSPQVVEDGGEEDEEELSGGEEADLRSSSGRGSLLTRRGITLRVLLKDGLVEPGDGVLAIHYLGKNFVGDLLTDGKIRWVETGQIFNSPSAWATHCKRLVNPAKKSGCGWASVRYRGQKLVQYKTTWLHKYQPSADMSLVSEEDDDEDEEEGKAAVQADDKNKNTKPGLHGIISSSPSSSLCLSLLLSSPLPSSHPHLFDVTDVMVSRRTDRERIPVRYCTLGTRDAARDPHTLVELSAFSAINRFQPFNVAVSSNVLLLMICQNLFMRGLSLVGWYHSHPRGPALPSLQDIDSQMDHQLRLQGSNNGFQPCLGIICGPYYHGNQGVASTITPFWVVPPPEQRPNDYGIPVAVEVTYVQDNFLTSDVLNEMMLLVDYYRAAPDLVQFNQYWCPDTTMLDKIKGSLSCHAPKDQAYSQILEHVYSQLGSMH